MMARTLFHLAHGLLLAGTLLSAGPAAAGGVYLPGYGSGAQPRAGAFVARADDPSAVLHNPAGLANIDGTVLYIGLNLINFSQTYARAGEYEPTGQSPALPYEGQPYGEISDESSPPIGFAGFLAAPLLAISTDLGKQSRWRFGAGVFAPGVGYPNRTYSPGYVIEQDPDSPPAPGRYDILEQNITLILPSLAVAYSLGSTLQVGARVSWGVAGMSALGQSWAVRNYEEYEGKEGVFEIDATDNFVPAAGIGVLFAPTPTLEFGASYTTPSAIHAVGTGHLSLGSAATLEGIEITIDPVNDNPKCATGGTAVSLKACATINLPQTAIAGGRWIARDRQGRERGDVEVDVQWEDWSAASEIKLVIDAATAAGALQDSYLRHGFRDTISVRVGGSYVHPLADRRLIVRAGMAHDTAAAPNSWTRLNLDGFPRNTYGVGLSLETGNYRFDLGGGAVREGTRVVPNDCNPTEAMPGCRGDGTETPVSQRDRPDPVQPLSAPDQQVESPFNAGRYTQNYLMFSMGMTARF